MPVAAITALQALRDHAGSSPRPSALQRRCGRCWVDGTWYDAVVDNVGNHQRGDQWLDAFRRLVAGKIRIVRSDRSFHQFTANETSADLTELLRFVEAGQLRSIIDRTVALEGVPDVVGYLCTGHARAKVGEVSDGWSRSFRRVTHCSDDPDPVVGRIWSIRGIVMPAEVRCCAADFGVWS